MCLLKGNSHVYYNDIDIACANSAIFLNEVVVRASAVHDP